MTTLTVSQVNRYIKSLLDEIPPIQNVYVMGEISNFKYYHQSGHMYFTLKDSSSQLKSVMFAMDNSKLKFMPQNGMNVVCFGKVGVYEKDGVYQLYVHGMQPKGTGELALAYEQLKEKLENLGWFDEKYKKPIPKYPTKIGVATSNMGAAVEDIKNVITRRFPACEIIIAPTIVQGDEATDDIVKSVKRLDSKNLDLIILGRGGGSLEDLWAFNTEKVAKAVFECKTPIISAVGHETDFTICDFVSDLRAPTPSAAAELAVPDISIEMDLVKNYQYSISKLINYIVESEEIHLDKIVNSSPLCNVDNVFTSYSEKLINYKKNLHLNFNRIVDKKEVEISKYASMLNALSPLAVLSRGYSITRLENGNIANVENISIGDTISTKLSNGNIKSKVIEVAK